MFKHNKGGVKPMPQSSMPQKTATGSGSGVKASKVAIKTSAPMHPHKLDGRHTPGAMK